MSEDHSQYTWEELLEAADRDTGHMSFSSPFTKHWGVREIVRRIEEDSECDFMERITAELGGDSNKCHHWAYVLFELFGRLPDFPPEIQGKMSEVNKILFDWLKEKDYINSYNS